MREDLLMKKKMVTIVLSLLLAVSMCGCGDSESATDKKTEKQKESEEKVYLEESEIGAFFSNPKDFKGKYIKLDGRIFMAPEKGDGKIALQAQHDPDTSSYNFIVYTEDESLSFKTGDYIVADGEILGELKGENLFGGKVTAPVIQADSIEIQSYMDAVVPTIAEYTLNDLSFSQNGVTLKMDKVEYAEKETRVYATITNESEDKFRLDTYGIKLVQNGQQIEQDTSTGSAYEGNYPELPSEVLPGATSSGILVFPSMDYSTGFQLYAEGSSENWEVEFQPFIMEMKVKQ
jgi:hypothetical protein